MNLCKAKCAIANKEYLVCICLHVNNDTWVPKCYGAVWLICYMTETALKKLHDESCMTRAAWQILDAVSAVWQYDYSVQQCCVAWQQGDNTHTIASWSICDLPQLPYLPPKSCVCVYVYMWPDC